MIGMARGVARLALISIIIVGVGEVAGRVRCRHKAGSRNAPLLAWAKARGFLPIAQSTAGRKTMDDCITVTVSPVLPIGAQMPSSVFHGAAC